MPAASALTGVELVAGVQSGANVKVTASQVNTYVTSTLGSLAPRSSIPQTGLFYVAKNGNDTNAGDIANPFLTIGAAITAATSGTTIDVAPGNYVENVTLKAGVSIQGQQARSVYVTGNMTAAYSGTVYLHSLDLQGTSGAILTISGSNATKLDVHDVHIDAQSGATNAVNYTATNALTQFEAEDGSFNVINSSGGATVFTSSSGSAGSIIWEDISARIADNLDNVSLNIGGAVSFVHTLDTVDGSVQVANSASYIGTDIRYTTSTVPVLTTNSSSVSALGTVDISTTAVPAVTGAGLFAYGLVGYSSTGYGFAPTLNVGTGAIIAPISSLSVLGTVNKVVITPPSVGSTLTIANGKTLTASNSLTLSGTDSTAMTFPSTSATIARTDAAQSFTGNQTFAGNTIFSVAASGPTLKQGANGRVGTFVANGATPVTVNNTSIAVTDAIAISLNTVGGTISGAPYIVTITGASGFTVAAGAADTSTYNYAIIKNAA